MRAFDWYAMSVTLNDVEWHNVPYFALFQRIR